MYIERQISYLHSQVSLAAYKLHKSGVRNNFRRGTVYIALDYCIWTNYKLSPGQISLWQPNNIL